VRLRFTGASALTAEEIATRLGGRTDADAGLCPCFAEGEGCAADEVVVPEVPEARVSVCSVGVVGARVLPCVQYTAVVEVLEGTAGEVVRSSAQEQTVFAVPFRRFPGGGSSFGDFDLDGLPAP
jgi:hypothetical protein